MPLWVLLLAVVLLGAACSRGEATSEAPTRAVRPPAIVATIVPTIAETPTTAPTATTRPILTPTPGRPTPTLQPTATPIVAAIDVADQALDADGRLVVDRVVAATAGWLVVHAADAGGNVGTALGETAVTRGENGDVIVTIDPLAASETLFAMLHVDEGVAGRYEFPGADAPATVDGQVVVAPFVVEQRVTLPAIRVADQDLGRDVVAVVERVVVPDPAWLIIHADDDGRFGDVVGQASLRAGETLSVTVPLNRFAVTPRLHAVLYRDLGEPGRFELGDPDRLLLVRSEPVAVAFDTVMPPDVVIYSQPIIDGQLFVDRVISYGPGWLVIYFDDEGQIGRIVGQAFLEDGINEHVSLPVVESALTAVLYAVIHNDTGEPGVFEFPLADPQARYGGRLEPFDFRVDTGSFLLTADQPLGDGATITVPRVAVDVPAWIVVRNAASGATAEIIGREWLAPGHHFDVAVEIDPSQTVSTLYVGLYIDGGEAAAFDPEEDTPLLIDNSEVFAPMRLLAGE